MVNYLLFKNSIYKNIYDILLNILFMWKIRLYTCLFIYFFKICIDFY